MYAVAKAQARSAVARHWRSRPATGAARVARSYLRAYQNDNHDLSSNGEAEVVRRLAGTGLRIAVDVGAHHGVWTQVLLDAHPDATVHCFEASPDTAAGLRRRFADDPRVVLTAKGLAAEAGTVDLYVDRRDSSVTSVVAPRGRSGVDVVAVEVLRGDDYLADLAIDHVDYLKIDVEGFDLDVLRGFGAALAAGAIDALQFEYNHLSIASHRLLADYYALLEPLGYAIGKVHPDGVDFQPYRTQSETWIGPACVAVLRSRPDLIARLRAT